MQVDRLHGPSGNDCRYIHMPDASWVCQRDPPDFDDTLLQALEQKRQELDAKVARYIAKKQGQFDDYVAEKHRRYDVRTDERHKRHGDHPEHQHGGAMEGAGDAHTSASQAAEDENEARWFTEQREEDARQRAAKVSEELARTDEPKSKDSPDLSAQGLGSVRERDSEILQLLPGFLPLLEEQDQLSSSAPAANSLDTNVVPSPPRAELVRSCTMPNPTIKHSPVPRRSSLKQSSNGLRSGAARKAVRLSLGPRIVTPTQSPPNDPPLNPASLATLEEEARRIIGQGMDDGWKSEPERVYTEQISTEELLAASSVQDAIVDAGEEAVDSPGQVESPASTSPDKGKEKASFETVTGGIHVQKASSPQQAKLSYSDSPIDFNKEKIPQMPAASHGRRSSLTEEAKTHQKEPKKKKKKKDKARDASGPPAITPSRAIATTAISSHPPEMGSSTSARSISQSYQPSGNTQNPNSASVLSSSFADANNTGLFYPTRSRPPPSHLKPDEISLSAVDVPLPVGGFSSGSPTPSYNSNMPRASLGESYMALHFARRMAEKEKKMNQAEMKKAREDALREEAEEAIEEEKVRNAPRRERRHGMMETEAEDEFVGELEDL